MSANNPRTLDDNLDSWFPDDDVNLEKMSATNAGTSPYHNLNPFFINNDLNLEEMFGPFLSPKFRLSSQMSQQDPVERDQSVSADLSLPFQSPIQPPLDPWLTQVQANAVDTDLWSANPYPNQYPPVPEHYFYPDPSQLANEVGAGPYFKNAANSSMAPNQIQELLPSQNIQAFDHNQAQDSPQFDLDGQMSYSNGAPYYGAQYQQIQGPPLYVNNNLQWPAPFNQGTPFQNMPALNQYSTQLHPSPWPIEPGLNEQLPYYQSKAYPSSQPQSAVNSPGLQPHSLTSYQKSVQLQNSPERGSHRRGHSVEKPSKPKGVSRKIAAVVPEKITAQQPIIKIQCSDYQPLAQVPESWDCFEYNANGELEPGRTYSTEEIVRFLFQNPRHCTLLDGYSPKLGGLTLWIQRAPQHEDQCHKDPLAHECRFECCKHAGEIFEGQLRVAFDEQTRNFPNHNPQHNAGYVHLTCLESILAFPNICAQLTVKAEDRVLSDEKPKKNGMILRTLPEVDHLNRFIDFCSTNGRGPASYPSIDTIVRAHRPQHTIKQEIQALETMPYCPRVQSVWETQGRNGIIAENERQEIIRQQRRINRAGPQAQEEHNEITPSEYSEEQAMLNPARGRKRTKEPESDSEHESGSSQNDRRHGIKPRSGRKRARTLEPEPEPESLSRNRATRKKERRTWEAELERSLKATRYDKRRVRKHVRRSGRSPPTSSSSSEYHERRGRKTRTSRAQRRRESSPLSSSGGGGYFEPEKRRGNRGSSVEEQQGRGRRVSKKGAVTKLRNRY